MEHYINAIGCDTNMKISEEEFYKIKNARDFLHTLYQIVKCAILPTQNFHRFKV